MSSQFLLRLSNKLLRLACCAGPGLCGCYRGKSQRNQKGAPKKNHSHFASLPGHVRLGQVADCTQLRFSTRCITWSSCSGACVHSHGNVFVADGHAERLWPPQFHFPGMKKM